MGYVIFAARVVLGCVFLVSTVSKLRGRAAFRAFRLSLRELSVLPRAWVTPAAALTAGAELCVVLLLLTGSTTVLGSALAVVLLAGFSAAIAISLRRGVRAPCRCFGRTSRPLGVPHLARNALLLVVAASAVAASLAAPAASGAAALHPAGAAVAAAAGLALALVVIVFDDIVELFAGPPSASRPGAPRGTA